ncbi:MAG: NUDIX hydrolase [Pseudomonadota bacterium]
MNDDDTLTWQHRGRRSGPQLPLFDVHFDAMEHPQSGTVMDRLVLGSVDWVNMVAVDEQARCVMVRQYRFGGGYITLETPGGMVDSGEDSLTAARRELLEETGYGGGSWHYLGAVEPNPAIHDHLCHHWLAQGVRPQAEPEPGTGEAIALAHLSAEAVCAAARNGTIRHALALSALARVYPLWHPSLAAVAGPESAWPPQEWARR